MGGAGHASTCSDTDTRFSLAERQVYHRRLSDLTLMARYMDHAYPLYLLCVLTIPTEILSLSLRPVVILHSLSSLLSRSPLIPPLIPPLLLSSHLSSLALLSSLLSHSPPSLSSLFPPSPSLLPPFSPSLPSLFRSILSCSSLIFVPISFSSFTNADVLSSSSRTTLRTAQLRTFVRTHLRSYILSTCQGTLSTQRR